MIKKYVPQWMYSATISNWDVKSFDLTQTEAEKKALKLQKNGVDTVILFWLGKGKEYRHIIFDSVLFEDKYGFEAVKKTLKIIVEACHKNGIKVIEHHGIAFVHYTQNSIYNKTIDKLFYKEKAMIDWCQLDIRSGKINMGYYSGYMFCPNNPYYRDAVFNEYIPEILSCGIDGMMLDDVQILPDWYSCACNYCREKFHKETGYNLPENSEDTSFWGNFNNPAFKAWIKFRMKSTGDFHEAAYKAASKIKKDIISFTCCASESGVWISQCCGSSAAEWVRGNNTTFFEIVNTTIPFYNIPYITAHAKLYEAIGRPWNLPAIAIFYPKNEAEEFLYWSLSKSWGYLYWPEPLNKYSRKQNYIKWEKEHKNIFVKNQKNEDIAVLFSKQTRDIYGGCDDAFYSSEWMGFCQVLTKNNILFDIILDTEITFEKMSKYKIIILPNSACLSIKQIKAIKLYVKNGGNIIASFETSLYNENGDKLDNFALNDVFGGDYLKTVSEVNLSVDLKKEVFNDSYTAEIPNNSPLTFIKPFKNTTSYADIHTEDTTFKYPFIVNNNYGKGKSVYYAGKPGLMSYLPEIRKTIPVYIYNKIIPEYEKLIIHTIKKYLSYKAQIEFKNLPENIMINTTRKDAKIFVHFINISGCHITNYKKINEVFRYKQTINEKVILVLKNKIKTAEIYSYKMDEKLDLNINYNNKHTLIEIPQNTIERYSILELQ